MQINLNLRTILISAGVVLLLFLGLAVFWTLNKRSYESKIVDLQNEVAARDKTIEVKEGVYQKLALQTQDLEGLLNNHDAEIGQLKIQLDKQGAQLLTANSLVVQLKKDLVAAQTQVPTTQPIPEKPGIQRVAIDTGKQMDPFQVLGQVDVDCGLKTASVGLKLHQITPIKVSVVVSQNKDKAWQSSATSNMENFQVDISLAAVNPYMLEPKWYEKIGLTVDVGVGTNPGLLAGIGATYQIGKFEVGPRVWAIVDHGVSPYFGAQMLWHPFAQ